MQPTHSLPDLRVRVQAVLDEQHRRHRVDLEPLGPDMELMLDQVGAMLAGGKRLRAAFLYWGYRACGGPDSDALLRAASAMEIFQAAALIHDDVMDHSDVRRGMPSAHRALGAVHRRERWAGDNEEFGAAAAILAGDLCLTWTDELFADSGLPPEELARGRREFDLMRTQLMGGQFLDVLESVRGWGEFDDISPTTTSQRVERARTVIRFKSAKYSVEQPLLIGAHCMGADTRTLGALSSYGLSLGEAFQLRDDVLGVYGDPSATGKPAGDDLREGKRTVLIAYALDGSDRDETTRVRELLGRDDLDDAGVEWLRDWCKRTGAVERVERLIDSSCTAARYALDDAELTHTGRLALLELIGVATARES